MSEMALRRGCPSDGGTSPGVAGNCAQLPALRQASGESLGCSCKLAERWAVQATSQTVSTEFSGAPRLREQAPVISQDGERLACA